MKAYKNKQFLVFEFEDGKNVKYNLATGECIGKSGKVVKDICTQLRGYNLEEVINSFEEEHYKKFLKFVNERVNRSKNSRTWRRVKVDRIRNVGSFLNKIKDYSKYEQLFSAGLKEVCYPIYCEIKNIPKGLINICKKHNIALSEPFIHEYNENPNLYNNLLRLELNSIGENDLIKTFFCYDGRYRRTFNDLIRLYKYKPQSLISYIDNLMTYEALNGLGSTLNELYDYVIMMSAISDKYEKYPRHFLTTHKIASRNYNRLKTEFEEEIFNKRIDKTLEYTYQDYKFIYPKTTNEIKDEAVQQNNCVSSYIKNVIDGKCHILFMRKKDNISKSLVTIEVRDGKIVQAKGKYNRDVNEKEQEAIDKYNDRIERMKKVC
ncbi:PcfJ domain-containing protein [Clostridioides difficile]|uniref:PcfJ domain-containing protein n=1 Tax=Clostridioides difficile TaxID=1496 RepID=UPI002411D1BD|nr:PcfJ domain-containing protein [Clostridioides difficile]MBY1968783.1 PcfJ domain-containing protein [Clostridioides difficile]MDM9959265.1 PcfJ domain-containing protein [Clostridioides difficile]HBF0312724.1 PcfJ domain-containing protein [Clostridioides difficile]